MFTKKDISIFSEILNKDDVLILTHKSPDGDTLGTAFALKKMLENNGKRACVCCSDKPSPRFSFIVDGKDLSEPEFPEKCVVSVDIATEGLLGDNMEKYAGKIDYAIDHHITNTYYAKKTIVKPKASSAGEVLWELAKRSNIEIDDYTAAKLYTAISFDTGCFKFANVTPKTMIAAADLLKHNIPFEEINRRLFDITTLEQLKIENEVISKLERYCDGRITLIYLRQETVKKYADENTDTDGLSSIPRRIEGTVVGLSLKETPEGFVKVSLRSYDDRIDVSKIAANFGGGGHKRASGCLIKDMAFDEAKKALVSATEKEWKRVFPNGYSE